MVRTRLAPIRSPKASGGRLDLLRRTERQRKLKECGSLANAKRVPGTERGSTRSFESLGVARRRAFSGTSRKRKQTKSGTDGFANACSDVRRCPTSSLCSKRRGSSTPVSVGMRVIFKAVDGGSYAIRINEFTTAVMNSASGYSCVIEYALKG